MADQEATSSLDEPAGDQPRDDVVGSGAGLSAEHLSWSRATIVAIAVCIIVGIAETANAYIIRLFDGHPRSWLYVLREQLPWWVLWTAFMPAILWLARTYRFDDRRWRRSAVVHGLLGLAIAISHGALYGAMFRWIGNNPNLAVTIPEQVRSFLLRYLFMDVMTYGAAVGVYYSFEYFSSYRTSALAQARAEARAAQLELHLARARIHALRMELNPHFLFNALNAVSGLVRRREHETAIDVLARLGELLRTTLNRDMPSEVPLAEEIELLRRFLDIEMARFGDRLRLTWEVEPDARSALVPPLILQPLVENALRHGVSRRPGVALLRIAARRVGTRLELSVRDAGDGLASHNGRVPREGIGLSNVRARLDQLYGKDVTSLELTNAAGGGARATLLLPYHLTRGERHVAIGA